jgi:hypothetical protein
MSHLKASGDRDRWACRLPLARQLGQPGLVVRSEQLLITSLPRRRHMTREDWQVLDALQAACAWHADRMPEYAWLYPDYEHRRPIEITAPDPAWLARWRHDHVRDRNGRTRDR